VRLEMRKSIMLPCTVCPQVVLLYGTLYVIFMVAIWWPVKHYWVRAPYQIMVCSSVCNGVHDAAAYVSDAVHL